MPRSRLRYADPELKMLECIHLRCEGYPLGSCDETVSGTVHFYDGEHYREQVIELAQRRGWSTMCGILCRVCTVREKESS